MEGAWPEGPAKLVDMAGRKERESESKEEGKRIKRRGKANQNERLQRDDERMLNKTVVRGDAWLEMNRSSFPLEVSDESELS